MAHTIKRVLLAATAGTTRLNRHHPRPHAVSAIRLQPRAPDAVAAADGFALRIVALAAITLAVGAVALAVVLRIGYPGPLEWMETGSLQQVLRVRDGQDLFVEPDVDYVPYAYSPLYFYLCAPLVWLLGPHLLPLRIVALAASVGTSILLHRVVVDHTRKSVAGWAAVGLFVGSFRVVGAWFDVARPDTTYLFFAMAAHALLMMESPTRARWCARNIGAAAAILLSFYSKQTGLALGALLWVATARRWRQNLWVAGMVGVGLLASKLVFDWQTDGWFSFYMFKVPSGRFRDGWNGYENLGRLWSDTAIPMFPVALALAGWLIAHHVGRKQWLKAWEFTVLSFGVVALTWLSRMEMGSYDNNLLPMAMALALVGGVAVGEMLGRPIEVIGCLAIVAQLYVFRYDWTAQVPWAADWRAHASLRKKIADLEGPKVFTHGNSLGPMPGVLPLAHPQAVNDVTRADAVQGRILGKKIADFYRSHAATRVIADSLRWYSRNDINDAQSANYEERQKAIDDPDRLWPRTGMATRPTLILHAKP